MGKGKPRHNPNKPQNKLALYNRHNGKVWCQLCEALKDGTLICEMGHGDANVCKGNPYNCVKTVYHRAASRSDARKIYDHKK